ncbi:MAG TPA: GNAT family N-acetyltransferase [Candidatus Binatia bacterium]|nr:GNAT family N-acetyltransferase [Candidatus Binatia bacterium]
MTIEFATPTAVSLDWRADAALIDGAAITIRPLRPGDEPALRGFFDSLSPESIRLRYFSARHDLTDSDLERLTGSDGRTHLHIGAFHASRVVGVADYIVTVPSEAAIAFVVSDEFQGRGVASLLLEYLAELGRSVGLKRFLAQTMVENLRMLEVFQHGGFIERVGSPEQGVVAVSLNISDTQRARAAIGERERLASVGAVRRLLEPRSVAVIGAGRSPQGIGHQILRNLVQGPFEGRIYPVNRETDSVSGLPAYASARDVPGGVDLAVIAVPAASVPDAIRDCGAAEVRSLVIVSSGFAEVGPEGVAAERELLELTRRYGMRVVGPNCMGVINTDPEIRLNTTFSPVRPAPGNVAFFTQSGALGIAVIDEAERLGIGLSGFVSAGNKVDISGNDLLQYWEQDPRTDVILLYLESFGNPRRFGEIARRVSRRKPIVAVKGGCSGEGGRAAARRVPRTSSDVCVDALYRQSGVIRVQSLEQLFDVARVLASAPLPEGNRVAVVGNGGGAGSLIGEACQSAGLVLPELAAETRERLARVRQTGVPIGNPVELAAMAGPEQYTEALRAVLDDPCVDSVLTIFTPLRSDAQSIAEAIQAAGREATKPLLAILFGEARDKMRRSRELPVFTYPEAAAYALAAVTEYAAWRRRDPGRVVMPADIDLAAAQATVQRALGALPPQSKLGPDDCAALLEAIGVPLATTVRVETLEEALATAEAIGYPVVLKAASADIAHRTERGAVATDLASADAVRLAYEGMRERLGPEMGGAIVQPMQSAGVETILRVVRDRHFGPLVVFGPGGIAAELSGDEAFRAAPLTDRDIQELIHEPRSSRLLFGYRGRPVCDTQALASIVQRISALVVAVPEITEMELDPVVVNPSGAVVVDVKVRVEPWIQDPLEEARRLHTPEATG